MSEERNDGRFPGGPTAREAIEQYANHRSCRVWEGQVELEEAPPTLHTPHSVHEVGMSESINFGSTSLVIPSASTHSQIFLVTSLNGITYSEMLRGCNIYASMVHEIWSYAHSPAEEEGKLGTRKQKAEAKEQDAEKNKKAKVLDTENGSANGKSAADIAVEFEEFCKATLGHLSIEEMRKILEANDQDPSGSDDAIVPRCQDMMFYGPLEKCPICNSQLDFTGSSYACRGAYSAWTTCPYVTRDSPRKEQPTKVPDGICSPIVSDWVKKQDPSSYYPHRTLAPPDKPFTSMVISLSGRLSRTHKLRSMEEKSTQLL